MLVSSNHVRHMKFSIRVGDCLVSFSLLNPEVGDKQLQTTFIFSHSCGYSRNLHDRYYGTVEAARCHYEYIRIPDGIENFSRHVRLAAEINGYPGNRRSPVRCTRFTFSTYLDAIAVSETELCRHRCAR